MTVLDLMELVVKSVKDPQEDIFTAINIVSAQLMHLAAAKQMSIARGSSSVATVAEQDDVLLPAECRILGGNPIIDGLELHVMPPGGESVYTNSDKPSFYRLEGRRVVLAPTPDAIYQIQFNYFAHPEKVVELTDELPFGGLLDEVLPGLVVLALAGGWVALASPAGKALLVEALRPLVLAEEQLMADSINNQ